MGRLIVALLVCFAVAIGLGPGDAFALTISNPFHFREHLGPNTLGFGPSDRQTFGATSITPSGPPTTATATQGASILDLFFVPLTLFPDLYFRGIPFDPSLTGSWAINATRGADSATAVTPAIVNPQLLPLVQNLQIVGTGLTPTLTWDLPDLTGFDIDRISVRVIDAMTIDQFFESPSLTPTATSFTMPAGVLQFGGQYVFRIMLADRESPTAGVTFLENRSSTFTQAPYSSVPEPAPLFLLGFGLAGVGFWRRRATPQTGGAGKIPMRSQKIVLSCVVFWMVLGFAARAAAAVIFNNFGPGDTYQGSGATLSLGTPPGFSIDFGDIDQGGGFTPAGNFFLDMIELAVGLVGGPNELDVWLMADASGAPGVIIEAFHFTGAMGEFGSLNPPLLANSALHPLLSTATQYWLIASVTGPDALAAWNINSIGDIGPHACRQDGHACGVAPGEWDILDGTPRVAFRISGTVVSVPVPEPSTLCLLGSTLAGLGIKARGQSRRKVIAGSTAPQHTVT